VSALMILMQRELALAWGRGGGALYACAFYAGLATLLALAAGGEPGRSRPRRRIRRSGAFEPSFP